MDDLADAQIASASAPALAAAAPSGPPPGYPS